MVEKSSDVCGTQRAAAVTGFCFCCSSCGHCGAGCVPVRRVGTEACSQAPHTQTTNDPSHSSWQLQMWCVVIRFSPSVNLQVPHPPGPPEVAAVAPLTTSPVVWLTLGWVLSPQGWEVHLTDEKTETIPATSLSVFTEPAGEPDPATWHSPSPHPQPYPK